MKLNKLLLLTLLCTSNYLSARLCLNQALPRVVVVIVVDQLAYTYFDTIGDRLSGGLHTFSTEGIVYTNAHHPNGSPVTAVGHTSIGTGALAKHHGVIDNSWVSSSGKKIDATSQNLALIATLNKPFLAQSKNNRAIAISLKGRAAMGMVGDDTYKIWLGNTRFLTDAHTKKIASLVKNYNNTAPLLKPHAIAWQRAYNDPAYYQYPHSTNYQYASSPSLANASIMQSKSDRDYFDLLCKLPQANQMVLDLGLKYLQRMYNNNEPGTILLWLSLSTLDKVGHLFGPESIETIDTVYHLDHQIDSFIKAVSALTNNQTLYVLTADHGVMPIPELLKEKHPEARRIMTQPLIVKLNQQVKRQFGIDAIINNIEAPFVYLNQQELCELSEQQRSTIIEFLINQFKKTAGIVNAYQTSELAQQATTQGSLEWFLQNNIVSGRSGQITLLLDRYTQLTKHPRGTTHQSPYDFNTHVPLMFYWPGHLKPKAITQHVWVPQLHATLAAILGIKPASPYALPPLPEWPSAPQRGELAGSTAQTCLPLPTHQSGATTRV